ncbi:MAG TPA: hypothetical protein VM910_04280 [Bradyrhizobium sp.]|jgi:hypothetical protein|nr:hypothetical protein [Bradyrhizobium sp.]
MSKSFSQAPKPQQLTAEVISAFERRGAGQDTRARIPSNAENRDPTNVGDVAPELAGPDLQPTDVERGEPTKVETVKASKLGLGIPTKEGTAERTRRLSIDLPESWHRRFKIACTRADKKMIEEVTEFIKRRTLELEKE